MSERGTVVVIVTYGSRVGMTTKTVTAALAEGAQSAIVVTNGVSPSISAELRDAVEGLRVQIIALPTNTGSAGGFRCGIVAALACGTEWIWLLDDDNEPVAGCLARLSEAASEARIAAAPYRASRVTERAAGGNPLPGPGSFMYFDIFSRLSEVGRRGKSRKGPVSDLAYAAYGGLLIHRDLVRRIGLPDQTRILYEDDTEYTSRIGLAGGQIRFVTNARITDLDGKWSSATATNSVIYSQSSLRQYYSVRNRTRFDWDSALASGPVGVGRIIINFWLFTGLSMVRDIRYVQVRSLHTYFRAVLAGLRGRSGVVPLPVAGLALTELDISQEAVG